MKMFGPYIYRTGQLAGRKFVMLIHDDGKREQTLYSRWLMEQHLGRELSPSEHVDHVNEDPTDDRLENLQILTRSENAKKSARLRRAIEWVSFVCPVCGNEAQKEARFVRHNKNQGKAGPYCSRSCAGKIHN